MPKLVFKIASDWEEVVRLRNEIAKLKQELKGMDSTQSPAAFKALNTQLFTSTQRMNELVVNAAKAGAVMENDLKRKIDSATKASDELSEEIIKQRKIIRETQEDVRQLSEQYSKMGRYSPQSASTFNQLNKARTALNEQRYALGELQDQQAKNRLEVRKLTREYKEFASGTTNADVVVKSLTDSLKRTAAEIGGLMAIKKFGSDVIDATGKMQQLQVALSTILQSKSKADTLLADISQFALKTPFSIDDVATGAKQLLAYGSSANTVVNELSMLGDVASGLQIPLGQLIYLYGTLRTQGRAMTVDIRQFAGRGIPIYEELAKVLGVSQEQVGELVKQGKVGFKEVEQAFKNMTSEGGKLNNMLENSAGTWTQQIAAAQEKLFLKMTDFGNKYKEVFEFGIGTAEDLVGSLDDVLSVIGGLIAAYGTYKAALITAAIAQKAVGFLESIRLIAMYRKELGLATAAQQAFNVAAKSNVYVALLSVLVGVGTAVYMFTKRTNEATAAQEALNSVNKKADEEFSKQAATIDRLNGVLKSGTSSLDQKKKALSELQSIVPSYNANLNEEGKLINNNTEAIKAYLTQLEKQIRMKAAQEELEELYRKKRIQEKQQKEATANYNEAKSLYNSSVTITNSSLQNRGINTGVTVFSQNNAVNNQLKDSANKAKKELDSVNKELGETLSSINAIEKEIEQSTFSNKKDVSLSTISKEIEDTTNRIKTLKQEIADLRSGKIQTEAGKTVESVIEAKTKDLQQAEKSLQTLTGVKQDKGLHNNQLKQQEHLSEQLLSLRRKNQQDEINLMIDGTEKKLAQIDLDYQKEIDAIKKQKAEWEKAQGGKLTDDQTLLLGERASNAAKGREKAISEVNKEELEAMNRYLKEYGTFQQKRDAITKEYNNKMAKATTEGDKKMFQKEMEEALSSVDMDKLKQEINWELIFGDLNKVSKKSLEQVKQQLKAFKSSDEYKNMAVDQKKVIDEALNNIQSAIIDKGGLLGDLPEQLDALRIAQDELKQAQDEYNKSLKSGTDAEKEAALKKKNNAEKNVQNAEANVTRSADKTKQNLITLADTITQLGSSSEISLSQIGNIASGLVDAFSEAGSKIGGIIGAVFSLLDGIEKQGFDGFVENIFSSVFRTAASIWDTITFGAFSKITGSGDSDKTLEQDIEYLTQSNQDLKNSLDNLSEKMDKASVTDASDIYEVQRENILKQEANTLEAMQRSAAAYSNGFLGMGGSHSSNNKIDKGISASEWSRVSDIVGKSVSNAGQFFQLSSEQMSKLAEEDTSLYSKIKNLADDGYKNAAQYMDEYITYYKQLEELENAYNEKLTNTSFDNVRNDFKNVLLDMESDAEDFANDFEKMMQNAIVESLMTKKYDKLIQDWYGEFAEAMKSGGKIDEIEQGNLQNRWNSIVNQALAERDALKEMMGWESESDSTREASQRGIATASQDSVDENNGRLAVMQGHTYSINENVNRMATGIDTIAAHTVNLSCLTNIDKTMQSILSMRDASLTHLSNIDSHTARLEAIENAIVFMKNDINTMLIKGLKLSRN
jgi:tape measure domain-containing protein